MPDTRTMDDYVNDTLALLTLNSTNKLHADSMRGWVYKISEDIASRQKRSPKNGIENHLPYWTVKAAQLHSDNLRSGSKEFQGLHLEHPVPRGKIVRWLCGQPHPLETDVRHAISLFLLTCWVTTGVHAQETYVGSEACMLNRNGFKDSMPSGWCCLHGDPWDRYRDARKEPDSPLSDLTAATIDLTAPSKSPCSCPPNSPNRIR